MLIITPRSFAGHRGGKKIAAIQLIPPLPVPLSPALGEGFGPPRSGMRGRGATRSPGRPRAAVASDHCHSLHCLGLHSLALTGPKVCCWRGVSTLPASCVKDMGHDQLVDKDRIQATKIAAYSFLAGTWNNASSKELTGCASSILTRTNNSPSILPSNE